MSILASLLQRFENPVGTARPLWFDVSKWQGVMSAEAMKAAGCLGVVARATVGELYTDPYFDANWDEVSGTEMYRSSYGVYVPSQDWLRQLDHWFWVAPERDVIPRVIDLEIRDATVKPSKIAGDIWKMIEQADTREGAKPIIYTRQGLIAEWLEPYWDEEQINSVWWWLAQYTWNRVIEHAGPPDVSKELWRERVVMHQTADKKTAPVGAVKSKSIDYDRWELGNTDEMRRFIEMEWGSQAEPEPDNWIEFICEYEMNIRAEPTVDADIVGHADQGTLVMAVDVYGSNAWVKTPLGYMCVQDSEKRYMKVS